MPGKTPRVVAAQEALDAAIREMVAASDEMDLADAQRLMDSEREGFIRPYAEKGMVTHWAVAVSRTYWGVDEEDPADKTEYPHTICSALVRDDAMPGWMLAGLLRTVAHIAEMH